MFFCKTCADDNKWPTSMEQSWGRCEVCGAIRRCNDVPATALINPPHRLTLSIGVGTYGPHNRPRPAPPDQDGATDLLPE
jgi:hypothetical protein